MPYTALPDRRIPYDNDGSVVARFSPSEGAFSWLTGSEVIALNDYHYVGIAGYSGAHALAGLIWFFPEQREVTAFHYWANYGNSGDAATGGVAPQGSNDTTNGLDGTWETASVGSGYPAVINNYSWRDSIKPLSFTGGKRTFRQASNLAAPFGVYMAHLYGEKVAGQTPDDIIYIDHDTTPGVEYTAEEDFGDRPLATTEVRQFRVKNASGSLTANSINIQCNDADFAISTDNVTWVVTINIASLAPGAQSATMYIRNTTPAIGSLLGPRYARIVSIVGSWT